MLWYGDVGGIVIKVGYVKDMIVYCMIGDIGFNSAHLFGKFESRSDGPVYVFFGRIVEVYSYYNIGVVYVDGLCRYQYLVCAQFW